MADARPNILCVIADDFGVSQLACSQLAAAGAEGFWSTPHLDRLAAEGVRFARAYSTAPVCSPARASLYTGLHPARLQITDFIPGSETRNTPLLAPAWRRGLPTTTPTVASILRTSGYATGHFGKWHLAPDYNYHPSRPMDPESHGFDEVVVTRKPLSDADPETDPHHIEALTQHAIDFCTRPRAQPFCCVLAHNALHRPELAPASAVRRFADHAGADEEVNRPVLAAMVAQMDAAIGRLLDALHRAGRADDTIVVFTSDHGPLGPSERAKPLRGAKADLFEGGLRVPLLLRWPQRIRPNTVRDTVVSTMDLVPTLLQACGALHDRDLDGVDLWPVIDGTVHSAPRDALYWHYPHYHHLGLGPSAAIRIADYKLIEWFEGAVRQSRTPGQSPYQLFNVVTDPSETHDLSTREPARCENLRQRLANWRASIGAQEMRVNPAYDPTQPTEILPPAADDVRRDQS